MSVTLKGLPKNLKGNLTAADRNALRKQKLRPIFYSCFW